MRSVTLHMSFGAHHQNLNEDRPIEPYYCRKNVAYGWILVTSKIKYTGMRGYSLGFAGDGVKLEWGR